ncbi:Hypothetical predicted protein [Cloeon dipterum]|uniref:Uncharacterized protein n=1 Tax=Cloeon dipterum TaxID=197152 RepID=A0A8S1DNC3_9INSE|nr:Hypothetical predicted protein [Cloeon dipterum]
MRTPPIMAGSALVPVKIRREEQGVCEEETEHGGGAVSLVKVRSLELPAPLALQEEIVVCATAMEALALPPPDHPRLRHDSYRTSDVQERRSASERKRPVFRDTGD